ncbi:MAG: 50S ribosomal protein L33 [Bacteroidales bacterium]|nr:50S ribosomal protein L33 [Bacteroidales bacterium]
MAKKAKGNRVQVILESIETNEEGKSVVSRYITTKNKKNNPDRIERRKFHPGVNKVTVHKEIK